MFERLSAIAESLGIPVVSQHDYIVRQGGNIVDAYFPNDGHWTPTGHLWAAEAVREHIEEEWRGQCPKVEPRKDVEVDWIPMDVPTREGQSDNSVLMFQKPFGLQHRFHTPDGRVWVQNYPTFDLEGYRSVYESVKQRRPTTRSSWDVHIYADGLTYVKESCSVYDRDRPFFLHVFPEDESDLPRDSQTSGFEYLDFFFEFRGVEFDGKCMVSVDLPEYDITSIRTGQIIDNTEAWSAYYNFELPDIMDAVNEFLHSERDPVVRSNFDVYMDDGRLLYVKDSCNAEDRDLPFFLHVFPADENDLAKGREESGFDNLGFELMRKGGVHGGDCFAAVNLPEYDIASIRTGQWVRGEGNVWEANLEFGE